MAELVKKHIITLTGKPGTGKSSTRRGLSERLHYESYSSGDFMRQLASERGVDITTSAIMSEQDRTLDDIVDTRQREYGETKDYFVMDGRMGWYVIPQSFKVYLKTDLEIAARRVYEGERDNERQATELIAETFEEYLEDMKRRLESEERRYVRYYEVDPFDESNYDLVIDTGALSPSQVVDRIIEGFTAWFNQ